jgi:hypothetical protein
MNGDGVADVLFCGGDYDHRVYCVSGASEVTGSLIWLRDTGASNHAATVINDINGDGVSEVVIGNWDSSNQVHCLDGVSGTPIWDFHNGSYNYIMRLVTLADVNKDGYNDVAVGSWDRAVRVVDGLTGDLIWESYAGSLNGGDFWAVYNVDDVNGDHVEEVVGGSFDTKVYLFNGANGDTLWMYPTGNRLMSVRGTRDISGNGVPDVLAGTQYIGGGGGRTYALEGGEGPTAVGDRMRVDGIAEVTMARPGQVELRWTCDQPHAFHIYRTEDVAGKARGRRNLAQAFERGEKRTHEVLQAILTEKEAERILLTDQPIAPSGTSDSQWFYSFTDNLGSAADPARFHYSLAAQLPDGGEAFVLELVPTHRTAPRPVLLAADLHPNPFNPATTIHFELERQALVSLVVHDLRGRRVDAKLAALYPAGRNEIRWSGRDASGQELPSGVYLVTLSADGDSRILRSSLVR